MSEAFFTTKQALVSATVLITQDVRGKVQRHVKADIQPITIPSRQFSHIHVDIVGPLPSSNEVASFHSHRLVNLMGECHISLRHKHQGLCKCSTP